MPSMPGMSRKLAKQTTASSTGTASSLAPPTPTTPVPKIIQDGLPLPRAIVFDLDYTLWPFWVDTHVCGQLKPNPNHSACFDKVGESFAFYQDVPSILLALTGIAGIKIGVASRTCAPDLARDLLRQLHVPPAGQLLPDDAAAQVLAASGSRKDKPKKSIDLFDGGLEIYPSSKIRHFEALSKKTGIPCSDMLFFDDESRNRDTESLGVTMYLVRDGVTWNEIVEGIKEWRRRRGIREEMPI